MFALLEPALGDLGEGVNHSLEDIFLLEITVKVNKYLKQVLRVLTQLIKDIEDQVLVMVIRVARIKDLQEYLLDKNHYLLLQVLPEMQEETVEDGQT